MRSSSVKKDPPEAPQRRTTRKVLGRNASNRSSPLDLEKLVTREQLMEIAGISDTQLRSFLRSGVVPPAMVRDIHGCGLYPRAVAEQIRDQLHLLTPVRGWESKVRKPKQQRRLTRTLAATEPTNLVPGDLPLQLLPSLLAPTSPPKRPYYSGKLAAAVFKDLLDRKPLAHIVRDRAVRPDVLNCIIQEYQKLNGVGILTATATEKICDRLNLRTFDEAVLLQFLDDDRCPSCHTQPKGLCVACSRKVLRDTIRTPMKPQNNGGASESDASEGASRPSATSGTEDETIPES